MSGRFPLPFEVVGHTASFLLDDPDALQACTLTCRSWHSACRQYIYRTITLKTDSQLDKLERLLVTLPVSAHWIRKLRILAGIQTPGTLASHEDISHKPSGLWVHEIPLILPQKLKKLEAIEFIGLTRFIRYQMTNFFPMLSSFSSVKSLSLVDCRLSLQALRLFLFALPAMTELHVHNVGWDQSQDVDDDQSSEFEADMPHLTTFHFHRVDNLSPSITQFYRWLRYTGSKSTLRSIGVHIYDPSFVVSTGRVLGKLGDSIEHLELFLINRNFWTTTRGTVEFMQYIDLARLTRLRSLHLCHPGLPLMPFLLPRLASRNLEEITFTLPLEDIQELNKPAYSRLDELLAGPAFSHLSRIYFICEGELGQDLVTREVRRVFHRSTLRDVLRVTVTKNSICWPVPLPS